MPSSKAHRRISASRCGARVLDRFVETSPRSSVPSARGGFSAGTHGRLSRRSGAEGSTEQPSVAANLGRSRLEPDRPGQLDDRRPVTVELHHHLRARVPE